MLLFLGVVTYESYANADGMNQFSWGLWNGFPYGLAGAVITATIGFVVEICFSEDGCADLIGAGNYSLFE